MMADISLAPVRRQLELYPCSLEQLWLDYGMLWQQLGWQQSQVRLWARCLPEIQVDDGSSAERCSENPRAKLGESKVCQPTP